MRHPEGADESALVAALRNVERELLRLIAEGRSNQAIAGRLLLSPHTVKVHVRNIFVKLGMNSRTQAGARATAPGSSS